MQDKIGFLLTADGIRLIVFFSLLFLAAVIDLKTRIIPDWLWMAMVLISFIPLEPIRILGFLVGLPLLIAGLIVGGMGGGDIKISTACGMVLGVEKGITGLCIGLFLLLVFHVGKRAAEKIRKKERKGQAYPLVPFLFLGMGMSQWMALC